MLTAFMISSCKKFLDVLPDDTVYEKELFKNERGFTKALNGIYVQLGHGDLYGRELKYGSLDVLGGYWMPTVNEMSLYSQLQKFNFKDQQVEKRIDMFWNELYKAIHQTNLIIRNLSNIEDDARYNLIAGEVYGLRAYLHLEILKLFGPVIKEEGLDAQAIPYYLTADRSPAKFLPAKEVLKLLEEDLQRSIKFLEEDPIKTIGRKENANNSLIAEYTGLLDRRGARFNYYAAKATLARKSQWEGDLPKAYERANVVIEELKETEAIHLKTWEDDVKRFTIENIFGLVPRNPKPAIDRDFVSNNIPFDFGGFLEKIFYEDRVNGNFDTRYNKWFSIDKNNSVGTKFIKLTLDQKDVDDKKFDLYELQMIGLPEMYFIAIESQMESNLKGALTLLNEFRESRDIYSELEANSPAELKKMLIEEVRREYIGEGYLYSFYKRTFNTIHQSPKNGADIQPSLAIFKFPIPLDENIYNK